MNQPYPLNSKKLQELKAGYKKTIGEKIELLTKLFQAAAKDPSKQSFENLTDTLHKFGGSAGSYGYQEVSILCKQLDKEISERLKRGTFSDGAWATTLPNRLDEIVEAFKSETTSNASINLLVPYKKMPILFVIDRDIAFVEEIGREAEKTSFAIIHEADQDKALKMMQNPDFKPAAIVIGENAAPDPLVLIDAMTNKVKETNTFTALLLDQDNIDTRLNAINKGANLVIRKPVDVASLLKSIQATIKTPLLSNLRLLVLDDDQDFNNFVTLALSEIGVTVKAINESSSLFFALDAFQPQFLLLDFVLPKYNGLELLKALRLDPSYKNLRILVVSSNAEALSRLGDLMVKADDILFKPLTIPFLQQRILTLAEHYNLTNGFAVNEEFRSQLQQKQLMQEIADSMANVQYPAKYLVLVEINEFSELMKEEGNVGINLILDAISVYFEQKENASIKYYPYILSQFALIFDRMDFYAVEMEVKRFVSEIAQKCQNGALSFNCSAIMISRSYGTPDHLLEVAENALTVARESSQIPLKMTVVSPENGIPSKKQVFIIDPDDILKKILKNAFESHDLSVKTFSEGQAALDILQKVNPHQAPALVVIERKLPDMDGIDILRKLNDTVRSKVPFYFLTQFSSDRDISEGLKQGAVEYTGKPFNLEIFMQKALKTIFHS